MTDHERYMEKVAYEFFGYADDHEAGAVFWAARGNDEMAAKCFVYAEESERTGVRFLCRALRIT